MRSGSKPPLGSHVNLTPRFVKSTFGATRGDDPLVSARQGNLVQSVSSGGPGDKGPWVVTIMDAQGNERKALSSNLTWRVGDKHLDWLD